MTKQLIAKLEYYPVYEIRAINYDSGLYYDGSPVACDISEEMVDANNRLLEEFYKMQRVLEKLYKNKAEDLHLAML